MNICKKIKDARVGILYHHVEEALNDMKVDISDKEKGLIFKFLDVR